MCCASFVFFFDVEYIVYGGIVSVFCRRGWRSEYLFVAKALISNISLKWSRSLGAESVGSGEQSISISYV